MNNIHLVSLLLAAVVACAHEQTRDTPQSDQRSAQPLDGELEEGVGMPKTPMEQGNGQRDIDITQEIRTAVVTDDSFSFDAKNIKIITQGGNVTLRGQVVSVAERAAVAAFARQAAGVLSVNDQLQVKP